MSSGFLLGCTVSFVALRLTTPSSRTEVDLNRDFTEWGRHGGARGAAPRRFPLPYFVVWADRVRFLDDPNEAGNASLAVSTHHSRPCASASPYV